ncbi:beta strand repeat-containing protein [Rhabdochromatium marinum]|uniref:beta strand repeat-containing protein n=1 Tax=Rhabdochromatium marinum TaxID=48729 RepID=UPI00190586A9|nr:DUF4214 domain-containing protein [Rhabdochromatium marinum]MBK1649858.1 hypothetical protein [Rhabdochromatium marinum]
MTYDEIVQQFYIAMYDRPADPSGYTFWYDSLSSPDGQYYVPEDVVSAANTVDDLLNDPTYGSVIAGIITVFGTSDEFTAAYGEDPTAAEFVDALYLNTLNRNYNSADDADGSFWLDYYDELVAGGASAAEARAEIAILFVGGVDGGSENDQAMLNNKVALADETTGLAQDLFDAGLTAEANTLINFVRDGDFNQNLADETVYDQAVSDVNAEYQDLNTPPGETFTLTTAIDTIEGTENNDTIDGVASNISSESTLNPGDQIDGAAGTDTLNITVNADFAGFSGDGFMTNVEVVNLTNTGSSRTFSTKGADGVETYNLTGAISLSELASTDATVNLSDMASGTTTLAYATDVTTSTDDSQALGLNNIGTVKTDTVSEAAVGVTATGIEALAITATGDNVVKLGADDAETITAMGDGSLKITEVGTGLETVDASAMTGALDIDLGDTSGVTQVVGGDADDTIRATAGDLATNAEISGGGGMDTLYLKGAIGNVQYQMAGVETVKVSGTTTTFSGTDTSGLESVEINGSGAGDATFANLGTIALGIHLTEDGGNDATFDHSGSTTVSVTGGTKDEVNDATSELTLTNTKSLDIQSAKYNNLDSAIIGENIETLTSTNAGDVDLTNAATDLSGVQEVTIDSAGSFEVGALAALATANLSGTGSDAEIELGDLGAAANEYGVTLTAEGLSSGLTLGAIRVDAAGGDDVLLDLNGMSGEVKITTTLQGNTSVIEGDTVTIDAGGSLGQVRVGFDISGGASFGNAIVADTVNFTGSGLASNYVGATVTSEATMVGGIALDRFVMDVDNAVGETAEISLSGGLGNDQFLIADDVAPNGKAIVEITDYNNGDQTNASAASNTQDFSAGGTNAADLLESAGVTVSGGFTYINTVVANTSPDVAPNPPGGTDIYGFTNNGNTYFLLGDDADGTFEDGEVLIQVTGITMDNDEAQDFFSFYTV